MIKRKKNKIKLNMHMCRTLYKNVTWGSKPKIYLRSRQLNKHMVADSSLIKKGSYLDKNNIRKWRINSLSRKSRINKAKGG